MTSDSSQESWEVFIKSLYSPYPNQRETAVFELPSWADSGRDVSEELATSIRDSENIVSRAAAIVTGRIDGLSDEVIDALEKRLEDSDESLRRTIVTSLGQKGSRACPLLVHLLSDRDQVIQKYAASALEMMGVSAIDDLLKALSDVGLRRPAATVLARIGKPAISILISYLDNATSAEVRFTVVDVLEKIGPMVVPLMIDGLKTGQSDKDNVVETCGRFGSDAVPALIEMLRDNDVKHRCSAATALVRIGRAAVPRLIDLISDTNVSVGWIAAQSLTQIGAAAVPDLIQALATTERATRWVVSEILIGIGSQSVEALTKAVLHNDSLIRSAAAHSLAEIGEPARIAVSTLKEALKCEKDTDVCDVLRESIEKLSNHE
ncbi:MAG: HEAT repeat domain-containing protein [Candidatus Riflebacteria bacterium]|nr:HEAT repeat domain-containing protein [Candidatus Riflebacteria bacterium]